jgi:hypothetical protein
VSTWSRGGGFPFFLRVSFRPGNIRLVGGSSLENGLYQYNIGSGDTDLGVQPFLTTLMTERQSIKAVIGCEKQERREVMRTASMSSPRKEVACWIKSS